VARGEVLRLPTRVLAATIERAGPRNHERPANASNVTLRTDVIDSEDAMATAIVGWDALAVELGRPYCAPAWMLAWWRSAAPDDAVLRVIVVREGSRVIGIAPFFAQPERAGIWIYRLLCAGTSTRISPLAPVARRPEVAGAIAHTLRSIEPRPDWMLFEGTEVPAGWPELIAKAWPARLRPRVHRDLELPAPTVELGAGGFEAWLATRRRSFRRELQRLRRRWSELGASIELTPPWRLEEDLAHLERLHVARWSPRGGSSNTDAQRRAMLADAGQALTSSERFRLWTIRLQDDVAAAELFIVAGDELAAWGGGFDNRWQSLGPSIVTIASAAEDAVSRGERRIDLGEGFEPFKLRLGDDAERVEWTSLFPRTARYPLVRGRVLPRELRYAAARRLSFEHKRRLKRVVARFRRFAARVELLELL
jgi:CelD/BcsL family acetyltransferase involved in cellulose biosynthesis